MSNIEIGLMGLGVLLLLLALRMPVATAMMLVGFGGHWAISPRGAVPSLAASAFDTTTIEALAILPLFVLMGNLAGVSRMSRDLYDAAHAWVGHYRGGLASSTIIGCAGFSALSGSSLASALTMGRVALPEMQRYNYSNQMATGAIAAGGTLGILIPPSAGFVVYAILTEESIGRLFMAGVLPGIMLASLFVGAIYLMTLWKPELGPPADTRMAYSERFAALVQALPITVIIVVTVGGIYLGVYSATEAAGIGCLLAFAFALYRRSLTWSNFADAVMNTLRSTATTFLILIGAFVFTALYRIVGHPRRVAWFSHRPRIGQIRAAGDCSDFSRAARHLHGGFRHPGTDLAIARTGSAFVRHRYGVVRRTDGDRARDGSDQPTGWDQRVCGKKYRAKRAHERYF